MCRCNPAVQLVLQKAASMFEAHGLLQHYFREEKKKIKQYLIESGSQSAIWDDLIPTAANIVLLF